MIISSSGSVKMENSRKFSSEASQNLGSSAGSIRKAEPGTSSSPDQKLVPGACDPPKISLGSMTIARIYMEDTPYGFYIQVYESNSRKAQRFRMADANLGESCLDFMTMTPVKSFVKVTIFNKRDGKTVRIECLALRDKGYDCGNIYLSRNSLARRFAHIVFRVREEIVRISIHELSNFSEVVNANSCTSGSSGGSGGAGTNNDRKCEGAVNTTVDIEVDPSLSASSLDYSDSDDLSPSRSESSTPDFSESSSTSSSLSLDTNNQPGASHGLVGQVPLASKEIANRVRSVDLVHPRLIQSVKEEKSMPPSMTFGRSDEELVPLLGPDSRGANRKKKIARMMKKAGTVFNQFVRFSNFSALHI
ncbi:hypothetical protein MPTK1_6g18350 [Marchantia polymorpha subsp. ruderalis]|uniref:Uncharacterized protein n=2 Tax=Marchantia polymorpha TaxID=3197 RepID=A0AAF6BTC5_MARPO|nr:hypothetical protein MARPO_0038s0045 [Marchantia polymorpha]BBN15259.1 hypothetical protein Mp_6g18350 [Marchantia polymorpha subsp. ruderalis]|eukprot:PTQ40692.1 hypothetical protein MARPO_0038s0045 [Marchantia polymorpha]